jgi:hypothetical protein
MKQKEVWAREYQKHILEKNQWPGYECRDFLAGFEFAKREIKKIFNSKPIDELGEEVIDSKTKPD